MEVLNEKTVNLFTPCRDCIFAIYDVHYGEQTGCKVGRLEKFKKLNKVEMITDEDTYTNYYRISTICNMIRNPDWPIFENHEEKAREQIEIKAGIILISHGDDDALMNSLSNIVNQRLKPTRIAIVVFQREKSAANFIQKLKESEIKFDIINVLDNNNISNLIDSGARKMMDTQYYIVCEEGSVLPLNYIENIDKLINDDLKQISMIEPKDGLNGLTIQTKLHELLDGNFNIPLKDKIKDLAKKQGLENMIVKYYSKKNYIKV